MVIENRALQLWEKHRETIGLADPLMIDTEEALFDHIDTRDAKSAVIFLPKSKPLIDMTLALVSRMVKRNGHVVLVGEKNAGIESAKKIYEQNIGDVSEKIVGYHCALYIGTNEERRGEVSLDDFISYSPLSYQGERLEIAKAPGVFSSGELDEGTRLLLDHIPYDRHRVLDIGCGAGVIGALYKKKNPDSDVTLTDKSPIAIRATEKTMEKNGLAVHIIQSDVCDSISGTFDLILCNPPFHTGIHTDYSFIERFAKSARTRLASKGEIYIVCNSFLPYERTFSAHSFTTTVIVDTHQFKIIRAH